MDAELLNSLFDLLDGGSTFFVLLAWIYVTERERARLMALLIQCVKEGKYADQDQGVSRE